MNIVVINIFKCEEGHVLAEDIVNKYGVLVVVSYTIINAYIIDKLIGLGVETVKIFKFQADSDNSNLYTMFEKSYIDKGLYFKEILTELNISGKLDINKISLLSDSIKRQMGENDLIVRCLNEIHCFDEYTYYHSLNVSSYSAMIGKWLKLPEDDIDKLIMSGLLHDIGKTKVLCKFNYNL